MWLVSVAAALVLVGTLLLGRWQLQRAWMKERLADQALTCQALPALLGVDLTLPGFEGACDQRKVSLSGHWMSAKTVYLDNRQMNGRPGFFVVTPFTPEGSQFSILVQRGWMPRNFLNREQVQMVDTPTGRVSIEGRIVPSPSKLYELGAADTGLIRQNLDMAAFAAETGLNLLNKSVQQTGPATDGLQRDWMIVASSPDKHYGYAFQWFGLSALTLILYAWYQIGRFRSKKH
jgi:surfeit locus 1 family protein